MDYQVIKKAKPKEFKVKPNLVDFEQFRMNPPWEAIMKELDWLPGGFLNKAHECIDRHADGARKDKPALLWEGKKGESETYTFSRLKEETNKFANVLKELGVEEGGGQKKFTGFTSMSAYIVRTPRHNSPVNQRESLYL